MENGTAIRPPQLLWLKTCQVSSAPLSPLSQASSWCPSLTSIHKELSSWSPSFVTAALAFNHVILGCWTSFCISLPYPASPFYPTHSQDLSVPLRRVMRSHHNTHPPSRSEPCPSALPFSPTHSVCSRPTYFSLVSPNTTFSPASPPVHILSLPEMVSLPPAYSTLSFQVKIRDPISHTKPFSSQAPAVQGWQPWA